MSFTLVVNCKLILMTQIQNAVTSLLETLKCSYFLTTEETEYVLDFILDREYSKCSVLWYCELRTLHT